MFRTVITAFKIFELVSGSSEAVFNLIGTSRGLTIPTHMSRELLIDPRSRSTRVYSSYPTNPRDGVRLLNVVTADGAFVSLPLTQQCEPLRESDVRAYMSITPGSSFSAYFGNAMLLPPSGDHSTFRLMAGSVDPGAHCDGGTIGYANMPGDAISFNVQASLVAATGRTLEDSEATTQTQSQRTQFGIRTDIESSIIPFELYTRFVDELLAVAGVPDQDALTDLDWSTFIDRLPSIQYTVYRSDDSSEVVARILLEPREFIEFLPMGPKARLLPSVHGNQCSLGLNALKYIGLFLDYHNSRIGFCEPL